MKKIIPPIFAAAFLFASCGDAATNETKNADSVASNTQTQNETAAVEQQAGKLQIPQFSDESVNQNLQEANRLMDALTQAVTEKDPQKIADLGVRFGVWAKAAQDWKSRLKPEEMQKFSEFMAEMQKVYTDRIMKATEASAPGVQPAN